jgi:hypothetical protein
MIREGLPETGQQFLSYIPEGFERDLVRYSNLYLWMIDGFEIKSGWFYGAKDRLRWHEEVLINGWPY